MADRRDEVVAEPDRDENDTGKLWNEAYQVADAKPSTDKRDAGVADVHWTPEGKIDATFTQGEHTVTGGTYVARGDAKIHAEGSAVVYAFDKADVEAKGTATVYASDQSNAQGSEKSVVYARDKSTAYGFDESTVHAYGQTEVHAHDKPTVYAHDRSEIYANDSSTTFAYDHSFVWPREPKAPNRDTVNAFDSAVVVTSQRQNVDDGSLRPHVILHDNSIWIDYEPQFRNPIMHRTGNE